jgi:hypothetical protein
MYDWVVQFFDKYSVAHVWVIQLFNMNQAAKV